MEMARTKVQKQEWTNWKAIGWVETTELGASLRMADEREGGVKLNNLVSGLEN